MINMSTIDEDILYTEKIMAAHLFENQMGDEDRIYYSSNENINKIIEKIDINNKNVLSVLGSGDQAFHLYNKGASVVDVFDNNKLTIYYYYLRRWIIIYINSFYPDLNKFSIEYIKDILLKVKPNTLEEKDALNYWNKFVSKFTNSSLKSIFHFPANCDLKRNTINDIEELKNKITNDNFSFYCEDFSWNINIDKSYDLIYISNIPEWIYHFQGNIHMEIFKYNLMRLLNDNGVVLGTNITLYEPSYSMRKIFRDDFYLRYIIDGNRTIGYQYSKMKK